MKFIKLYENINSAPEDLKQYFKSKIDWKLINWLSYKITKYEDKGYIMSFWILVDDNIIWTLDSEFINLDDELKSSENAKDIYYLLYCSYKFSYKITFDVPFSLSNDAEAEERRLFTEFERLIDGRGNLEVDFSNSSRTCIYFIIKEES